MFTEEFPLKSTKGENMGKLEFFSDGTIHLNLDLKVRDASNLADCFSQITTFVKDYRILQ